MEGDKIMFSVTTGNQIQYIVTDNSSERTMPSVNPVKVTFTNTKFIVQNPVEQPLSANQDIDQNSIQELSSSEEALFYKSIREN